MMTLTAERVGKALGWQLFLDFSYLMTQTGVSVEDLTWTQLLICISTMAATRILRSFDALVVHILNNATCSRDAIPAKIVEAGLCQLSPRQQKHRGKSAPEHLKPFFQFNSIVAIKDNSMPISSVLINVEKCRDIVWLLLKVCFLALFAYS